MSKQAAKRRKGGKGAKGAVSKKGEELAREAKRQGARGPHLGAAKQALRDTLMLTRAAQGWTIPEIAAEAQVAQRTVKHAIARRRASMPDLIAMDPEEIIRGLVEQFQATIGDYERLAHAYAERSPNAAVGAKNGAQAARRDLAHLLQATGILPHELGTMRHLIDLRVTVHTLIESVQRFEERVAAAKIPKAKRAPIEAAAQELRGDLKKLAGLEQAG